MHNAIEMLVLLCVLMVSWGCTSRKPQVEDARLEEALGEILAALPQHAVFDADPGVITFRPDDRLNEIISRYAKMSGASVKLLVDRINSGTVNNVEIIAMIETLSKIENDEATSALERLLGRAKTGKLRITSSFPSKVEITAYIEAKLRHARGCHSTGE